MKTLEAILIERGELERMYFGELRLFLWRAIHQTRVSGNPLYPDFESRRIKAQIRLPDINMETRNGIPHVVSELGKGTSLFDRFGVFGQKYWTYFEIPEGTEIPEGLIIVRDAFNTKYRATHYTISPNYTMPKARFTALLDQLAMNARAKSMIAGGEHG